MQKHLPGLGGVALIGLVFSGILAILFGSQACSPSGGKMETLVIATVPTEINAPLYIAEAQGFFAGNGLRVTFKEDYDSGATATAGMLNGEADIATASEFVTTRQILNKKDIINFGTITKYENTFIIWRTDSGIKALQDLKGRRVGVTPKTISEFYLGRTFGLNGLTLQQVTLVDIKAADAERAIANREVDAVVTWEPWVIRMNRHMGKEVTVRPLQSSQHAYWNLVSTGNWAKGRPDTVRRLMKSLTEAEGYITRHNDEAKAIVGKRMKLDSEYLEIIWQRYQFSLSLDRSLIAAMEDEGRWMIRNGLTGEKQIPDFLDHIYVDGLKTVKPEAVAVSR